MNIHHVLIFCFISALCGDTGLVSARLHIFTGAEGGRGSISCHLHQPNNTKFFCKEECKGEGILIRTEDVRAQNGRFSTVYRGEYSSGIGILTVTIKNLTMSDAGRYRCGFGTDLVPQSYTDFEVRVSDELPFGKTRFYRTYIEGEHIILRCPHTVYSKEKFLCKDKCKTVEDIIIETDGNRAQSDRYHIMYFERFGLYVIITNVSKSDTGWYQCGYGRPLSPHSSNAFTVLVIGDPSAPRTTPSVFPLTTNQATVYRVPLIIFVIIAILLLIAVLLLVYKLKNRSADIMKMESVTHENRPPGSTGVKTIYDSVIPGR
ncbi:polymeric immunoglobulin receptor-like isoform X2 [Sparus aurata]|uniref:polymeric immunoglobulin receptor-like isoform X2 n=1 Tax=Sparus aurata TaxID=8175 RepID=UPI0011C12549|nr:polymeric immunoglobulin receptor-like isoform X2 [Sparus aurata]